MRRDKLLWLGTNAEFKRTSRHLGVNPTLGFNTSVLQGLAALIPICWARLVAQMYHAKCNCEPIGCLGPLRLTRHVMNATRTQAMAALFCAVVAAQKSRRSLAEFLCGSGLG